jgi:hypothetical protein
MARATSAYTHGYNSLAAYKAMFQPISTALNTALPRTADTGQVNWAAVATEPTVVRDYEIFSLGGPLAGAAPIFIRSDYKGGGGGNVTVTVGTTTDGAGNLGGLTVPALPLNTMALSIANPNTYLWAASDGQNYLTFHYGLDPAAANVDGVGILVVERTRDPDGTPNANGFHVWRWQQSAAATTVFNGGWSRVYGAQTQTSVVDYNINLFLPDLQNVNSGFRGTTSYAFPVMTYAGLIPGGASQALMFGFGADFPRGTPITLNHYGQNMTFVAMADAINTSAPVMTTAAAAGVKTVSPLIRWD